MGTVSADFHDVRLSEKVGSPEIRRDERASETALRAPAFELGVASYSLRNYSRTYVIHAIQQIGTPYVNIKSFHLDYGLSPAELAEMRPLFETFNNQELQRSKIIPTIAASIEQEHE